MNLEKLLGAVENTKAVYNVVEGGGLIGILDAIGDNEFEAAKLALGNMKRSANPKREVELAVGHLQSAHVAFRRIHSGSSTIERLPQQGAWLNASYKDLFTCGMMAVCYIYLGEKQLVHDALASMSHASKREEVASSLIDADGALGSFVSMLNPMQWKYAYINNTFDFTSCDVEQFIDKAKALVV